MTVAVDDKRMNKGRRQKSWSIILTMLAIIGRATTLPCFFLFSHNPMPSAHITIVFAPMTAID